MISPPWQTAAVVMAHIEGISSPSRERPPKPLAFPHRPSCPAMARSPCPMSAPGSHVFLRTLRTARAARRGEVDAAIRDAKLMDLLPALVADCPKAHPFRRCSKGGADGQGAAASGKEPAFWGQRWEPSKVTFERDGFFSPQAEAFRRHAREYPSFKPWFDYAFDLNRLGYEMLRTWGNPEDKSVLALNTSFVRFHKSFQSIVILAERGLVPDARAVLRSAVECAIAIHALADDAGFWDQMVEAHHRDERKFARISRDKLGASLSADASTRLNE